VACAIRGYEDKMMAKPPAKGDAKKPAASATKEKSGASDAKSDKKPAPRK